MKKGENIKYLIIGAGNLLLSDEGMGIHIVNKLQQQESFKDTEFVDIGTSTLDIGSFLSDDLQKIVIVDCINTAEYKEGTVFKLTLDDLRARQLNKFSLHQMELVDSLKLLSIANNLPPVIIIGVVPHNISTFSINLSQEIESVFPEIVEKITKVIEDFFKIIMHEYSITCSIIDIVKKIVDENKVSKVSRIDFEINPAASLEPYSIKFYYEFLTRDDSILNNARLVFKKPAKKIKCCECGAIYLAKGFPEICPKCLKINPINGNIDDIRIIAVYAD